MTDDLVDRMKRKIAGDRKALAALATVTCPFCGHVGAVTRERRREHQGMYSSRFWAECGNDLCCCHGRQHDSEADAAREWLRLALAVQVAEAAWLREAALDADMEAIYCGQDPGAPARLFRCASDEMCRLLDEWGEDGPAEVTG